MSDCFGIVSRDKNIPDFWSKVLCSKVGLFIMAEDLAAGVFIQLLQR